MRRLLTTTTCLVVLGLLALAMAGCSSSSSTTSEGSPTATTAPTATSAPTATATPTTYPVLVYFSKHPDTDSNPAAVSPVNRTAPNLQVATYAMQQLIIGPTAAEAATGLYTPLTGSISGTSNCGGADFAITLNMKGTTPESGTATLKFCRTVSLAGDLTSEYIAAEINTTLKQFSTIKKVVILTKDGGCFNDLSGMNLCLK